jgi:hypothetical protein
MADPRTSSGWRGAVSILIMPTLCPFTRTLLRGSPPRSKAGTCPWTYHGACGQAGAAGSRVTAAGRSLTLRRSNTNSKRPTGIRCGYTSAARVSWRPSVDAGLVQPDMPPRTYPFKVELSKTDYQALLKAGCAEGQALHPAPGRRGGGAEPAGALPLPGVTAGGAPAAHAGAGLCAEGPARRRPRAGRRGEGRALAASGGPAGSLDAVQGPGSGALDRLPRRRLPR